MAKVKGNILFADDNDSPMKLTLNKGNYKPNILFEDEEEQPAHKQPEQLGFKGIGQDILGALQNIPNLAHAVPGQLEGIQQQYNMEPSRIGKNLLAGAGEAGIGILNAPHDLIKYLGKKELLPEWLKKYNELPFTHIPENLGVEKALGLEEQKPGDAILKLIPQIMGAYGIKKALGPQSLGSLERNLNKTNEFVEQAGQRHKAFLGEGQEHGARASQQFVDYIEGKVNPETGRTEGGLRRQVGSQYEQLSQDMANEQVKIHQTPDMKAIQKSITKLGKTISAAEREKLMKLMTTADSKLKTVNGSDALTSYRELKRQRSKALQNAYEPGIGPKEHEQWIKRSQEFGDLEKKMKAMLESQIGGNYLERLKSIDKEYATKIAPLSENTMYQEMLKHGQTSKNMMRYLNGTTAGNQTLNSIVLENPELQRLIVGQKFAENPSKLLNASDLLEKYKTINPFIEKVMNEQGMIKHAEENIIPELKKSIKKSQEKKILRKGFRRGAALTGAGLGASYLLGGDIKKDLPVTAAIRTLFTRHK